MTATTHRHHPAPRTSRATAGVQLLLGRWIVALADRLYTWRRRVADRQRLLTMDDRMLSDIGVGRCEAWHEGQKPFWSD